MYFDETQLNDNVLDALYDMRFDQCTPIQEKCIPPILEGRDLLGVAQTGTGKTAAYLLPILSKLDDGGYPHDAINCVIMSPTRELAQQIDQAMQGFGYYLNGVSSVAVYGGNDGNRYDQELKSFQMGADVVIATPGRLISHISLGSADLSKVSFFVLDEADRMLDMGFSEDIKMIASKLPATCQTIMFSATMPEKIEELAKSLLKNPVEVKIAVSKPAEKIKQSAYVCYETQKIGIVKDLFRKGDLNRVIIFSGKKQKVKAINRTLQQMKINSGEMHSDLEQAERDDILYKFKTGQIDVLVATDIVARGIDIDDIAMVINFDVPHDPEDYVHRIGRTARAQRDGIAITFVSEDEISSFKQIEKFLGRVVDKNELPEGLGETPDYNAPRSRGRGGKGRDEKRPRNNSKTNGSHGDNNKRRDNRKKNSVKEQNNNETSATETPQTTNAQETVAETTTPDGTQPTTQKKRRRKPNRKPANAEGGNNQQTENGAKESNANNNKGDNAKRRNERAARDGEQAKQNNEQPNREGGQTKRNNQQRRQRKDNASRRSNQNRKQDRKENGKSTTAKSTPNVPAIKQPTTLTTILKKPLNWLKSLGKKKN
ncbi:DEAD/DEAH box helicase [Leyella stercorea DSM 18206]|uniref:DEAD/DEAH box helicase n=1 Tax=Leyella stercorea DSM 18206 TaxID=1002367 RepID=G6B246_9BACT|nr:DEAD/DEAH box helicase [Leyella stercorea]EHJ35483.1 DEAD/DEAH box helicase [Leyella stercorea DSM 18206]